MTVMNQLHSALVLNQRILALERTLVDYKSKGDLQNAGLVSCSISELLEELEPAGENLVFVRIQKTHARSASA